MTQYWHQHKEVLLKLGIYGVKKHNATPPQPLTQGNKLHPQKNTVTTQKIQLFTREEKPLNGVTQSH
jgi:hypothetical protein